MHTFMRRRHSHTGTPSRKETGGLILDGGWRYDLEGWVCDRFVFRGQWRAMRQRAIDLAELTPGERVLDVGCGTGTLALALARRVGNTGYVAGIDPGVRQIARAKAKAARHNTPIAFRQGVIERLPFPDGSFDVVFSTLMMHHLPQPIKRQGLAEIRRVLRPGGRLIIADFRHKAERQGRAARFHAGGSRVDDLAAFVAEAGFTHITTETMKAKPRSLFPGAYFVQARTGA